MKEENQKVKNRTLGISLIISIIGLLVVILIFKNIDSIVSYLLGVTSSMLGFIILVNSIKKTEDLKKRMVINYFIRYLIYFVFLGIVALLFEDKYLLVALSGIIVFKATQIIYYIKLGGGAV